MRCREHSLWPRVHARLDEPDTRRAAWPLWAVAAAVIAVIVIAIAQHRARPHAVADLLGIGATQVQHVDRLPDTEPSPSLPSKGDRAALDAQLAQHHLFAPDTALAGVPVAWLVDPKGETVVAYQDVALSQRALAGAGPSIKRYAGGGNVQFVQVGSEPAVYVGGQHTRTIDGHTFRSGNALIWDVGRRRAPPRGRPRTRPDADHRPLGQTGRLTARNQFRPAGVRGADQYSGRLSCADARFDWRS